MPKFSTHKAPRFATRPGTSQGPLSQNGSIFGESTKNMEDTQSVSSLHLDKATNPEPSSEKPKFNFKQPVFKPRKIPNFS